MANLRRNRFGSIKKSLRNAHTADFDVKRDSIFMNKNLTVNQKSARRNYSRPPSGITRSDVKHNESLEMERYSQSIVDMIGSGAEAKKNHWGEIASVICCMRSDVYLQSLIKKTKDYYLDPKSMPMFSRKRKARQTINISWSPPRKQVTNSGALLSSRSRAGDIKLSARVSARGGANR